MLDTVGIGFWDHLGFKLLDVEAEFASETVSQLDCKLLHRVSFVVANFLSFALHEGLVLFELAGTSQPVVVQEACCAEPKAVELVVLSEAILCLQRWFGDLAKFLKS
jgi:hypothetical protein